MKKLLCLLLCLLPLCALAEEIPPLPEEDFVLTIGDTAYTLGEDATALLAALEELTGKSLLTDEAISCMFDGMDREFMIREDDVDIVVVGTYPIGRNGGDVSESVIVSTDILATARGAIVGMTTEDIEALYGEPALRDHDALIYQGPEASDHQPYLIFGFDVDTNVITYWIVGRGVFV